MSQPTVTKIRFENGVWEGRVAASARPEIEVRYRDLPVDGVELVEQDGGWVLKVPVPKTAVSDGVHGFVIFDTASNARLGDFTLIAGEPVADDLRAELTLLREELDMLKRAFRRHCAEGKG